MHAGFIGTPSSFRLREEKPKVKLYFATYDKEPLALVVFPDIQLAGQTVSLYAILQ
jgi:hypothetical protein